MVHCNPQTKSFNLLLQNSNNISIMVNKIVLAGGSGFIGTALEAHFRAQGCEVIVLTRAPSKPNHVQWDGRTVGDWSGTLDGAAALVNLTGKNVNCRWTDVNKREIVASRVDSINTLGAAIAKCGAPPAVWVQSGGIDFVGDGDVARGDDAPNGSSFLSGVCAQWERAFAGQTALPVRRVLLRFGPVLGWGGGPLPPLATLARFFLGGSVGSGAQHFSWLHLADAAGIVDWSIAHARAQGTYNAVAPNPVTNAECMRALRKAYGRPWSPPVPSFAARIGAALMRAPADIVLGGAHGAPKRLLAEHYAFKFAHIDAALAALVGGQRQRLTE